MTTDERGATENNYQIEPEELARLLLLPEYELDKEIWRNIKIPHSLKGAYTLIRILMRVRLVIPWTERATVYEHKGLSEPPRKGILRKSFAVKKRVLSFPGKLAAGLVRRCSKAGGRSTCVRIDYCRLKAWFRERIDSIGKVEEEGVLVGKAAVDLITANIPDGEKFLDVAKEFTEEVAAEVADAIFPGGYFVKVFKYGLDDLCPCCDECNGSGSANDNHCKTCNGDGLREPFLQ